MCRYSQALPSAIELYESKVRLLTGKHRLWADACINELRITQASSERNFRDLDHILAVCLPFSEFEGLPVNV